MGGLTIGDLVGLLAGRLGDAFALTDDLLGSGIDVSAGALGAAASVAGRVLHVSDSGLGLRMPDDTSSSSCIQGNRESRLGQM